MSTSVETMLAEVRTPRDRAVADRFPPRRAAVYRCFNSDGVLIYVGKSINPDGRLLNHSSKIWWLDVDESRTVIDWFDSERIALDVEEWFIARYHPTHNTKGGHRS